MSRTAPAQPRPPAPRLGAVELSRRLGQPHPPTPEQVRAIEHLGADGRPGPLLVVAGAGSGKTETMAARVVWLVANRLVRPERILGLTFTRKAAGELAERIRRRLAQLARSGVVVPDGPDDDWLLGEPSVSTYHAYAASLFTEHALRVGREPGARLLGEAVTWQYAGRVVDLYDGDMSDVGWTPSTVVGAVRALAGDLSEHLVGADDVRALSEDLLTRVEKLPRAPKQRGQDLAKETRELVGALRRRLALLPLVEAYEQRKRDTESLDHGDQVALAARIAREHPAVGAVERDRYDVVLLDEYQDTGTSQRVLLMSLFGGPSGSGHAVTAVGDPCQSIYGWRGASAGNLARFPRDFPQVDRQAGPHGAPREADQVDLTTSFRNGGRILALANRLSEPLRAHGVPVRDLRPGPKGEHSGEVRTALLPDLAAEADWIARLVAGLVLDADGEPARYAPGDVAVLTRTRSQLDRLERALRARGLPVEVSGLGGLLGAPEVRDVVAVLSVMDDLAAGPALVRLLTGPRWRIGPRDLVALGRRAGQLARPLEVGEAKGAEAPEGAETAEGSAWSEGSGAPADTVDASGRAALLPEEVVPDEVDGRSLVEALDDLGRPEAYSAEGYRRLRRLADELRGLRARAAQPLPDLVADVVRTIGVDVEVSARAAAGDGPGRAHLDRFLDVAADFADTGSERDTSPTLAGFLAYLEAAEEHERGLEGGRVGVVGDAVQLLTMHGAKGLEWPVVIVPGLTGDVFPSKGKERGDWCANAKVLPFPLRGDAADLPVLGLERCADQKEVQAALQEHDAACRARDLLEERRLLYVAATRAEDLLVLTGTRWATGTKVREPSPFLVEAREACAELGLGEPEVWAEPPAQDETNPLLGEPAEQAWPLDPLPPERRAALDAAVQRVRAAAASPTEPDRAGPAEVRDPGVRERLEAWTEEVDRLLAERTRALTAGRGDQVLLPAHLSVSQLVALRRDPAELALRLRRPVPVRPAPLARRGTAFHAWLEERFGGGRLLDVDELPGSADADAAPDGDLEELKERFLASEWADRHPVEVEVPFETLVAGVLVRGRMDAVFTLARADGQQVWDVVDWKTGQPPSGEEARAVAVQLAAYRLAWHRLTGAPLEQVRAAFHYVRAGRTVRPVDLLDADGLAALIAALPAAEETGC
ncbi:MAG TPA: ATP-dependent DNA helicase [Motilibacteraceae bacterium]|nr:ATP-dependent DNA helicase [Motilibacteraceae bacterium]